MNTYPLWLLDVPETQPALFHEVDEERKNLRYWRGVFLKAVKPKLENGSLLSEEEWQECQRLRILIPTWIAVSFDARVTLAEGLEQVRALADECGGTVSRTSYGRWEDSDGNPKSNSGYALEFRFEKREGGMEFFERVGKVPEVVGSDTAGLDSPYWHENGQSFA